MSTTKKGCCIENCNKKISIVDEIVSKCKCGFKFCILHRLAEKHNCTYDFKSEIDVKGYIERNKCVAEKLYFKNYF